jgi:hypothetical protein
MGFSYYCSIGLDVEHRPTLVLLNDSAGFNLLMFTTARGLQNKSEVEQNGSEPNEIAQDSFSY